MATGQLNGVLHTLRRVVLLRDAVAQSDAELLGGFIASNEESAFAGLVRRHGPMVFGVCRRVLGNTHDAEDAFQAAFLVLARKAATIRPRSMVGNWLYGVAYRTALRAKTMIAKRQARERQVRDMPDCTAPPEPAWSDLGPLIDQELNALADNYRVPVVLCDLEGKSQREAAKQLGWPVGTLMTRLARARQMLAKRLSRQGVALSAGVLAMLLTQNGASASVPATLTVSTTKAAALVAGGQAATALLPAKVTALTEGVLQAMFIAKIKSAALVLFVALIVSAGTGLFLPGNPADQLAAAEQPPLVNPPSTEDRFTPVAEQERGKSAPDPSGLHLQGRIVAVAKDGKSFTLETTVPSAKRGEDAVKNQVTVKIDDKTELKFFGVGLDGAKLSPGMLIQVWTREGAKDVAAIIQVGNNKKPNLEPDISGKVTSVSKDGNTLGIEIGHKNEGAQTVEIKLTARTAFTYSGVVQGGTKPTVNYFSDVRLEPGSKTDVAAISFRVAGQNTEPDTKLGQANTIHGTLTAIANDGKLITVEKPPQEKGGEAEQVLIKISDTTRVVFTNIPPDGDKLTQGSSVFVSLAEGTKDVAAIIVSPQRGKTTGRFQHRHGRVMSLGKDGKSFTIEMAPQRAQPAEKVTINISEHTRVIFNGVGAGGARLTEGLGASVWLDIGSNDAAFQVVFGPLPEPGRR